MASTVNFETNARWVELVALAQGMNDELSELDKKIQALKDIEARTKEQEEEMKELMEVYAVKEELLSQTVQEQWAIEQDMEADARGDTEEDARELFDFGDSQADW